MVEHSKYDPEDIESLLRHKNFDELYESERNFVLRHLSSQEEYAAMRNALLLVDESSRRDDQLRANPKTKQALLRQFEEQGPRPVIWLNTLMGVDTIRQKPMRVLAIAASIAVLLTTAIWWWNSPAPVPEVAEQLIPKQEDKTEEAVAVLDSSDAVLKRQNQAEELKLAKQNTQGIKKKTQPKKNKKAPPPQVEPEPMLAQAESNPGTTIDPVAKEHLGRNFAEDEALESLLFTAL